MSFGKVGERLSNLPWWTTRVVKNLVLTIGFHLKNVALRVLIMIAVNIEDN
jgi:hypothetical protein